MDNGRGNDSRTVTQRLSRRSVLLRGCAVAAGGVITSLLAACGGAGTAATSTADRSGGGVPATTGGAPTTAPASGSAGAGSGAKPVSGGSITLGYTGTEIPTMDPRITGSAEASNFMTNLFDTLVTLVRETGETKPGLATSWDASPDGKVYTFKLRPGVKFHDGTPFDAAAVKYTFDSIVDPALKSLTAIGYLGPYDRTDVVDDHTVTVRFKEPYAPFLNTLSSSVLAPVSPTAAKKYGNDDFGRNPVGTGPFMFKEWKQQVSMTLVKNPGYAWPGGTSQHDGLAYLDQMVMKFFPDATTLDGTLGSGESTIIDAVLPQNVKRLQGDNRFQILLPSVPGSPQILPLNAAKAPTDDLKVRQAILYGVDTQAIVDSLWFGTIKAARGPLASSTWAYDPKVEASYPFDPKKAAQLLDEAGWTKGSGGMREKNGQPLTLEYITVTGIQGQAAQLVQSYLATLGMKVNLQILEYAATATAYLAGKHNIARIGYTGTDPVALSTLYHSRNIPGTNFNRTMKPDAKLDTMLDDATAEMDREKRKQRYFTIQEYIMDQALMIPLWEQTIFWGASAKVKGLHPLSLGQIGFYDAWLSQ